MESSCGAPPLPNQPRFTGQIPPAPFSSSRPLGCDGGPYHRRAHSETFLRFPDDILFDSDPDFGISDLDLPSFSDENLSGGDSAASAAGGGESSSAAAAAAVAESRRSDLPAPSPAPRSSGGVHLRSLSMDAAFFEGLSLQSPLVAAGGRGAPPPERKGLHRRSGSVDGVTSSFEGESAPPFMDYAKKAMTEDKLAELALIDPKRAKRILANRQSAARSKERKIRYTSELERKIQTLQTEATTLSAQLTLLQRDTTGLTTENRELKLRLQALEQQAQLRDALNEALREEVQRLRIVTGQIPSVNGNSFNIGFQQSASSYSHQQQLPHPSGQQAQHQHPSQAQRSSNSPTMNDRDHTLNDSMDFM